MQKFPNKRGVYLISKGENKKRIKGRKFLIMSNDSVIEATITVESADPDYSLEFLAEAVKNGTLEDRTKQE